MVVDLNLSRARGLDRELQRRGRTNILLSSVGRRSYLVHYFQRVLAGKGLVIATNSVNNSPGMAVADVGRIVPPASDDHFPAALLGICIKYRVSMLFSLHDWEAPFIAANLDKFRAAGTVPVVSRPEVIGLCLDKLRTQDFAMSYGINYPVTVSNLEGAGDAVQAGTLRTPIVVKPRFGQGSIGIEQVRDAADLGSIQRLLMRRLRSIDSNRLLTAAGEDSLIYQEVIEGEEFGLDVVNDLQGKFVACFVKRKIAMRNGETDVAETVRDDALEELGRRIGSSLGHIGPLDVDLIVRDGVPYLLEMNPRFGGHYPFSHMAGANVPAALMAWAFGLQPDPSWLRVTPGVRCFKDIAMIVDERNRTAKAAM